MLSTLKSLHQSRGAFLRVRDTGPRMVAVFLFMVGEQRDGSLV